MNSRSPGPSGRDQVHRLAQQGDVRQRCNAGARLGIDGHDGAGSPFIGCGACKEAGGVARSHLDDAAWLSLTHQHIGDRGIQRREPALVEAWRRRRGVLPSDCPQRIAVGIELIDQRCESR
jgi:hypothetical protein